MFNGSIKGTVCSPDMQQHIDTISQRTKDVVFGYIRISSNVDMIIPIEICYICLLFYYLVQEKFIECGDEMEIISSDEENNKINDTAKVKKEVDGWRWIDAIHGNMMINLKLNPEAIAIWTITGNNEKVFGMGIHSSYSIDSKDLVKLPYFASRYCRRGDIMKMELNIPKLKVIFYKNDEMTKEQDIEIADKEYHLVIRLHTFRVKKGDYIRLTDFHIKGDKLLSCHTDI